MKKKLAASTLLLAFLWGLSATAASAGGWVVITLDALPTTPRAGESLLIGFMVRQHGQTPISDVEPRLIATHSDSGEKLEVAAVQEGRTGHFVVEVAFPQQGAWSWQIEARPFPIQDFGLLEVLPAPAVPVRSDVGTVSSAEPVGEAQTWLRWGGIFLLGAATGMFVAERRREAAARPADVRA